MAWAGSQRFWKGGLRLTPWSNVTSEDEGARMRTDAVPPGVHWATKHLRGFLLHTEAFSWVWLCVHCRTRWPTRLQRAECCRTPGTLFLRWEPSSEVNHSQIGIMIHWSSCSFRDIIEEADKNGPSSVIQSNLKPVKPKLWNNCQKIPFLLETGVFIKPLHNLLVVLSDYSFLIPEGHMLLGVYNNL